MESEQTSESAEAAASIQYAIFLLRQKFVEFIPPDYQTDSLDFNKCLSVLKKNKGLIPGSDAISHRTLVKQLERARRIRNNYSHQNFDIAQFHHDVECLEKIAALVRLQPEQLRLSRPSKDEVADWEKLKADGNKFYAEAKWEEAIDCYTRAISLNSKSAVLYSNRALCELQLGKWELAREDAEDAIELDPGQVKYYRTLSQALSNMSLLTDAIEVCTQGLALDRTDVVLRNRLRDSHALLVDEGIKTHPVAGDPTNMSPASMARYTQHGTLKESDVLPDEVLHLEFEEFWTSHMLCSKAHKAVHHEPGDLTIREKKALNLFEEAAARGYAEGLYNVGVMYKDGSAGLPRDFERALEYFHKAAGQRPYLRVFQGVVQPNLGVAEAETIIGIHYRDGLAVDQNERVAFKWFLRAAQHGCPSGMNNLGVFLQDGKGCKKDIESARLWFSKAAELGLSEAMVSFAQMLIDGIGGPVDVEKGMELLKGAADQGLPGALYLLQTMMRSGRLGATGMTTTSKLVKAKSDAGDREAVFLLGVNYHEGSGGCTKDLDKAEEYFRKAAAMKHPGADLALGMLLLDRRKNKEAFQYIKKAAETTGDQDVQHTFGMLLAFGHGCEREEKVARRWLVRSGRYGNNRADVDRELQFAAQTLEFEKANHLKLDGLTVQERKNRFLSLGMAGQKNKTAGDLIYKTLSSILHGLENPPQLCSDSVQPDHVNLPQMIERARQGSKTAQKYFQAQELLDQAINALQLGYHSSAFELFRKAKRLWELIRIPQIIGYQALMTAKEVFDSNPRDAEALFFILTFEEKNGLDHNELVEMAKTCVNLNPKMADYYHVLGCLYGFVGDHRNSLRSIQRALDLEMNPDWLYTKATALRLMETEKTEVVIKAYEDYIAANEKDDRKIPEAYYCIGSLYLADMENEEKAREYRDKARQAEQPPIRLPCFGAVKDDFPPKLGLDFYFKVREITGKTPLGYSPQLKEQPKSKNKKTNLRNPRDEDSKIAEGTVCAFCGNPSASSWCGQCRKVRYCDRQCQKQHWKEHKITCHGPGQ